MQNEKPSIVLAMFATTLLFVVVGAITYGNRLELGVSFEAQIAIGLGLAAASIVLTGLATFEAYRVKRIILRW